MWCCCCRKPQAPSRARPRSSCPCTRSAAGCAQTRSCRRCRCDTRAVALPRERQPRMAALATIVCGSGAAVRRVQPPGKSSRLLACGGVVQRRRAAPAGGRADRAVPEGPDFWAAISTRRSPAEPALRLLAMRFSRYAAADDADVRRRSPGSPLFRYAAGWRAEVRVLTKPGWLRSPPASGNHGAPLRRKWCYVTGVRTGSTRVRTGVRFRGLTRSDPGSEPPFRKDSLMRSQQMNLGLHRPRPSQSWVPYLRGAIAETARRGARLHRAAAFALTAPCSPPTTGSHGLRARSGDQANGAAAREEPRRARREDRRDARHRRRRNRHYRPRGHPRTRMRSFRDARPGERRRSRNCSASTATARST